MSGGTRTYTDEAELEKRYTQSAIKDKFLGWEAQYEAVSTLNVSCVRVLSITILYPRMVGKLVFLAITNSSVVNSF